MFCTANNNVKMSKYTKTFEFETAGLMQWFSTGRSQPTLASQATTVQMERLIVFYSVLMVANSRMLRTTGLKHKLA